MIRSLNWLVACALTILFSSAALFPSAAYGQLLTYADSGSPEDPGLGLLQEDPHDILTFKQKAGGGWAKARLLPSRELPNSFAGTLRFEILGIEGKQFTVKWGDIEQVDFWEKRLERETSERIASGDFAGAYPFLSVLIRDYPKREGIKQLRSDFLWRNAIQRASGKQRAESLAMLEELQRFDPRFRRDQVLKAISATTDSLMRSMMEESDLDTAQKLLARLKKDYDGS
ncbi:MAG: peptide ABC transporter substrate-binding protein, partial [Planctomycetota bacterium]